MLDGPASLVAVLKMSRHCWLPKLPMENSPAMATLSLSTPPLWPPPPPPPWPRPCTCRLEAWVGGADRCMPADTILDSIVLHGSTSTCVITCNVMQTWSRPEQDLEQDKTLNCRTEQRQAASCQLIISLLAREVADPYFDPDTQTMPLYCCVSKLAITSHNLHAENTQHITLRCSQLI